MAQVCKTGCSIVGQNQLILLEFVILKEPLLKHEKTKQTCKTLVFVLETNACEQLL